MRNNYDAAFLTLSLIAVLAFWVHSFYGNFFQAACGLTLGIVSFYWACKPIPSGARA